MSEAYSAWNPGLEAETPAAFRSLETIYRCENVSSRLQDVDEISSQTGLGREQLVVFRPERLALHELIVRITADILVREGRDETELGRNFRQIATALLSRCIQPRMGEIVAAHAALRDQVYAEVRQALTETLFAAPAPRPGNRRLFPFLGRRSIRPAVHRESIQAREHRAITGFKERGLTAQDPLERAVYKGLYRVLNALAGNRGVLGPDSGFLSRLVCNHVCNHYGSERIGALIAPWLEQEIQEAGYLSIANAAHPQLISLKGASAAGKSSLRPMLKQMMSERGIRTEGYATISPDIWRRLLLDYDTLGEAFKYAGRLTSQEVIIIDGKLDRYIRNKAELHGAMPHLLVDRFRFDSFSTERISRILHGTYVKHVDTLLMYFVITPPHATVERGWERGLLTGRYKAVEDFLDHSVEAYTGMPRILFKWLAYDRPLFRYEFLDNSVSKGTFPRTIAFGTQQEMNILDCSVFIDIERYQKINVKARSAEEVYSTGPPGSVASNIGFLKQCLVKVPTVNFIDTKTGTAYAMVRNGVFTILDENLYRESLADTERGEIFAAIAPQTLTLDPDK